MNKKLNAIEVLLIAILLAIIGNSLTVASIQYLPLNSSVVRLAALFVGVVGLIMLIISDDK